MKKLFLVFILITAYQSAQAQMFTKEKLRNLESFDDKRWSWGYYLGFNSYDFKIEYYGEQPGDIEVKKEPGFNIGLIGDMKINNYINLRLEPGVMFASRKIIFPEASQDHLYEREVKSTYIHIPLLLKFSTKRINNFKPFVVGGVSGSINLSSNENNPDDNYAKQFRMQKTTTYWEVGFGIDFYLPYFKFTPSIRGVFALSDELKPDDTPNSIYTSNIDRMSSRGIFINFTFQ